MEKGDRRISGQGVAERLNFEWPFRNIDARSGWYRFQTRLMMGALYGFARIWLSWCLFFAFDVDYKL